MASFGAYSLESVSLALHGADRLEGAGPHTPDQAPHDVWAAVEAVGGEAVFGEGCEVLRGDPPQAGDKLAENQAKVRPFTRVVLQSGAVEAIRA